MQEISGKVIRGEKIGRRLGFPTANLDRRSFARRRQRIKFGIWAGYARIASGKNWLAGIVIGPSDKAGLPKLEVHLIGFRGSLYGKRLSVSLNKYLRPFKKYSSEEKLIRQIKKDIRKIKQRLYE